MPVALVLPVDGADPNQIDAGRNRLAIDSAHEADRPLIVERLAVLADSFDLAEPFRASARRSRKPNEEALFHGPHKS